MITALRRHPFALAFAISFLVFGVFYALIGLAHAAPTVPDPTDHPIEFWQALADLRTSGGLYVVIAVALATIAKSLARVLAPAGGGAATGLRGRAISTLTAIGLVAGALVDLLLGPLTGTGLAVAAAGAAALVQDPRDRPPSAPASTRAATAPIVVALVLGLLVTSSCATARRAGAAGANTALTCQTESLQGLALEAYELARHYVVSLVSGTGQVDTAALRIAARQVRTDAGRCAFAAALAAVTEAMAQRRGALGVGPIPAYVLRRELEVIARHDWQRQLRLDGEAIGPSDDPDEGGQ